MNEWWKKKNSLHSFGFIISLANGTFVDNDGKCQGRKRLERVGGLGKIGSLNVKGNSCIKGSFHTESFVNICRCYWVVRRRKGRSYSQCI